MGEQAVGQFATKSAKPLPDHAVQHYVDTLAADPEPLRSSFGFYRALDTTIAQNQKRRTRLLPLPVLAIGGAESMGTSVGETMKLGADDVESLVLPECGRYPAEEAPEAMLSALTAFLAPYRDRWTAADIPTARNPGARRSSTTCNSARADGT
ncbi:alpha/beta fold hydrolase [Streptomyces phaeochromogenes]